MRARRPKPRTRLTQAGVIFVVIAALVQMASLTTGENLLYLLSAGVFSLLLLSAVLTRFTLRNVSVERLVPGTAERGALFRSSIRIDNRKRRLPTISVQVEGGNVPGEASRHVGAIGARTRLPLWLGHRFERRGIHRLPPVELHSGFPLGLFRTRLIYDDRAEVTVLPRVQRVRPAAMDQLDGAGEKTRRDLGEGDEFFSLRDYAPGDDVRRIAWKVSARLGKFVVRELEPTVARHVCIYFDTRLPASAMDHPLALPEEIDEDFESAVDLAASLAVAFLDRQYAVSLMTPVITVPLGEGTHHCERILRMLALVDPLPYSPEPWPSQFDTSGGTAWAVISADASNWGGGMPGLRGRILHPQEVTYA